MLRILRYELVLALRRLYRRRVPTALMFTTFTVAITLALVSWSLFYTIFLRAPEFDPDNRLCVVEYKPVAIYGIKALNVARVDIEAWQESQTVFSEFTGVTLYQSVFLMIGASTERVYSAQLSAAALHMVGAKPLLGRLFTPAEDKVGSAPVMLLSQHTWENKFGGDPHILGKVIKVEGAPVTIIGVMPASFRFPNNQDVWTSMGYLQSSYSVDFPFSEGLAILKPGTSFARAEADLDQITKRRGTSTLAARFHLGTLVTPFREYYLFPQMHRSAVVLLALALAFVLIGCANTANLVLIDFLGRMPETASTLALGLPRGAMIRGVCFPVIILASLSAAVSMALLLVAAPPVFQAVLEMNAPYWLTFTLAWHHFAVAGALAAVSAAGAILGPIGYLLLTNPEQIIRQGAGAHRGTARGLLRRTLLAGQIAMLTVLGIAAGLLVQSSYRIGASHRGYDAGSVYLGKLDMDREDFPTQADRMVTIHKVIDEVSRLPDVRAAAVMTMPPGYSQPADCRYALDPATLINGRADGTGVSSEATDGVFDALGVPFLAGQTFPRAVTATTPNYVVIDESMAARLWPRSDPIGRALYLRFRWMDPTDPTVRAVVRGVVRDFQAAGPMASQNDCIYLPMTLWVPGNMFFMAGGNGRVPNGKEISDAVARADPRVASYFPDSIRHQIDMTLGSVHLTTALTTIFALAAGLLCALGVYSITVSQIMQRSREFGIRLTLGIGPARLWARFVGGHLVTVLSGILIGLVAAFVVVRFFQALLFGIGDHDPLTFAGVGLVILVISGLASVPSLFRLRRIQPADCLRGL